MKHNMYSTKRNNMTSRQDYQSLRWVIESLFICMPAAKACKAYELARPFCGPYCSETGVVVHPVNQPQLDHIRVAYNSIECCSDLIPDTFWSTIARVIGAT